MEFLKQKTNKKTVEHLPFFEDIHIHENASSHLGFTFLQLSSCRNLALIVINIFIMPKRQNLSHGAGQGACLVRPPEAWVPLWVHLVSSAVLNLEKAMAPHSSALAWKIPWMEEPGGLQSMGSLRVGHD